MYTAIDVPAGSPLRLSYGDYYLTNPSATFGESMPKRVSYRSESSRPTVMYTHATGI